jgi:dCTP diphosphatase
VKNINLCLIEEKLDQFAKDRDWEQFHSIKNLSMALSVESSELMEIFQWMTEAQSNQIKEDEKKLNQVKEELADIFLYLVRISSKLGVNLELEALSKIELNNFKYPASLVKGSAKKYDEY